MYPDIDRSSVAWVDRAQMIEVDRIMIEDLGISLLQMMEIAGRNLADLAITRFDPGRTLVLAGSGGNGGGGLAAARHLHNRGRAVQVLLTRSDLDGIPGRQLAALHEMGVTLGSGVDPASFLDGDPDLVIDAVIGYSLGGAPRGAASELIVSAEGFGCPILSLDVPSGIDVDSGLAPGDHIRASATMTLAAPKRGLLESDAVGELYLADISVPPAVFGDFGVDMRDVFAESTIVRLR